MLRIRIASVARSAALVSAVGIGLLMALTTADVILRGVANSPIPGALEIAEVLLVATVFLGIAHTYVVRQHVEITALHDRMPPRVQTVLNWVQWAITSGALAWLSYATAKAAVNSVRSREFRIGLMEVPIWPARIAVAVGCVFLLIVVVGRIQSDQRYPSDGDDDGAVTDELRGQL
jgi:TRAP-type transport system small permease protein